VNYRLIAEQVVADLRLSKSLHDTITNRLEVALIEAAAHGRRIAGKHMASRPRGRRSGRPILSAAAEQRSGPPDRPAVGSSPSLDSSSSARNRGDDHFPRLPTPHQL